MAVSWRARKHDVTRFNLPNVSAPEGSQTAFDHLRCVISKMKSWSGRAAYDSEQCFSPQDFSA